MLFRVFLLETSHAFDIFWSLTSLIELQWDSSMHCHESTKIGMDPHGYDLRRLR
jgi:hypothetical protein